VCGTTAWLLPQTSDHAIDVIAGLSVLAAVAALVGHVTAARPRRSMAALSAIGVVLLVGATCWVGANSPKVTWFGSLVSHGDRSGHDVALTFDDGPNAGATLAIGRLLAARDAKGTFFEVGKAVARRPDITRALVAAGHLVADHSYRHDSRGWLDPRYPELARTQRTIDDLAGVCPAFYRPPHGQHTPFLALVVHRHAMTMVGWDVSAGDWASHDARRLADRVLARVRPGSIIDLHDGLDGNVGADRQVLVRAMPRILDGLAKRGLHPVRLDVLLHSAGYLGRC